MQSYGHAENTSLNKVNLGRVQEVGYSSISDSELIASFRWSAHWLCWFVFVSSLRQGFLCVALAVLEVLGLKACATTAQPSKDFKLNQAQHDDTHL